jgi:hypothetical protein
MTVTRCAAFLISHRGAPFGEGHTLARVNVPRRRGFCQRDLLAVLRLHPFGIGIDEPRKTRNVHHVGAEAGDAAKKSSVQTRDRRPHQGYRDDANHDSERRQNRPHLVRPNGASRNAHSFDQFTTQLHETAATETAPGAAV